MATSPPNADFHAILQFWFAEITPPQWWQKNAEFDALIIDRFLSQYEQASRGELYAWRRCAAGRLAEIILLDQLPRNMFRDTARAFATDSLALVLAQEAIAAKVDSQFSANERVFLYMPMMHSESRLIHQQAERLFRQLATDHPNCAENYRYEQRHRAIIQRFGRYPHRNAALNRPSTPAELAFLQQPGSGF